MKTEDKSRVGKDDRRQKIERAAAELVVEEGWLPLPLGAVASRADVSKGLIYAHFPSQYELLNAVLDLALRDLVARLRSTLKGDASEPVVSDAIGYFFDHSVAFGPVLHILFSDQYLEKRIAKEAMATRNRLYLRFGRIIRQELRTEPQATMLVLNLLITMIEESAKLVRRGHLELKVSRQLCIELVWGAIEGLIPSSD